MSVPQLTATLYESAASKTIDGSGSSTSFANSFDF